MTVRSKQLANLIVRITITIVLLLLVFRKIDFNQFWQTVKTGRWEFLIAVWIFTVAHYWIRCITLRLVLKKLSCNVSIAMLFRASAISALYSMIMPGMLSSGAKWYILKKDTGKGTNVFSGMLYNQLLIIITTIICGLAALMVTNPSAIFSKTGNHWLLPVFCGSLLFVVILMTGLLLNHKAGGKVLEGLKFLLKVFPIKIRQKGQEILDQITVFQTIGWRFHLTIVVIAVIGTLVEGVTRYVLAARGANIAAPAGIFIWIWAIIYLLGRLPVSFANLGIREAVLVWVLPLYGAETSAALLMSMILLSGLVIMAVIGGIYQFSWALQSSHKTNKNQSDKPF